MSEDGNVVKAIGVGIDTARYGHHVTFLREDRQQAAAAMVFSESGGGYEKLKNVLLRLQKQYPGSHFCIRIDSAGQYATNLERFLHSVPVPKTISVGEPKRNKNYREAHFPKRKSDATDSYAAARYAVVEKPKGTPETPVEFYELREVASRLEGQIRQTTRATNQLHNLLSRVFPELATVTSNLRAGWVLRLLKNYPSAERIGKARVSSLAAIPYMGEERAKALQAAARESVGSFQGKIAEELIRQQTAKLEQSLAAEKKLEKLLVEAFGALPEASNHALIMSIPGIGKLTAAAVVAKVVSIERFETASEMASYFGVFPEEHTSGVDKKGNPLPSGTMRISKKGNDLVRKYLWLAAKTGILHNPALRALYARQRAKGKRGDVALGHCMRKMLHLVFAVWKSGKAFDPNHYPWDKAPTDAEKAAGRKQETEPARQAVAAA